MSSEDSEQGNGAIVVSIAVFHHCLIKGANHNQSNKNILELNVVYVCIRMLCSTNSV